MGLFDFFKRKKSEGKPEVSREETIALLTSMIGDMETKLDQARSECSNLEEKKADIQSRKLSAYEELDKLQKRQEDMENFRKIVSEYRKRKENLTQGSPTYLDDVAWLNKHTVWLLEESGRLGISDGVEVEFESNE